MSGTQKSWIRLLRIWCVLIAVGYAIQGGALYYISSRAWTVYTEQTSFVALLVLPPISVGLAIATLFKPKLFWFLALSLTVWLGLHLYMDITLPKPANGSGVFSGTLLRRLLNLFIIWMTIRLGRKATSSKWDDDIKSVF